MFLRDLHLEVNRIKSSEKIGELYRRWGLYVLVSVCVRAGKRSF